MRTLISGVQAKLSQLLDNFSTGSFPRQIISLALVYTTVTSTALPAVGMPSRDLARRDEAKGALLTKSGDAQGRAGIETLPATWSQPKSLSIPRKENAPPQLLASLRPKAALPVLFQTASAPSLSTISSNFNGTSIAAGSYIWFNAVVKVTGVATTGSKLIVENSMIQFTSSGQSYNIHLPNAVISFSPQASSANTYFDSTKNQWVTTVPVSYSGNVFLGGVPLLLPNGLSGGTNPVDWTATFYTDTQGVSVNWKWAAAVYPTFSNDPNAVQAKPIDGNTLNPYLNSDHAGTPEAFKPYVTGGARGGGGSNYTGSYSGTAAASPAVYLPPIANAGTGQTVFVNTEVHLDGTGSTDPEGNPLSYAWRFVSIPDGSNAVLSSANAPTPSFLVDKPGTYSVQLIVTDWQASSAPVIVTINTQNSPPIANAGPDLSGTTTSTVQLDGSGSTDVDGDRLTYHWSFASKPDGSNAALSDVSAVRPTFVIDVKGTYTLNLVVNDGTVDSSPDQVVVSTTDSRPVAKAIALSRVIVGTPVTLDGSKSSDIDGDSLTYSWSLITVPDGSHATLSNANDISPMFVADLLGTYVAQLVVNDGTLNSDPAATVTITSEDNAPVAYAGDVQTVTFGTVVALDGTHSSDVDGQQLTYKWSILSAPAGSAAALSDPASPRPTFTADRVGDFVVQLTVNDGYLDSTPVTVTITTANSRPTADTGVDQPLTVGQPAQLDGSKSTDVDGDLLTYRWSLISVPSGSNAAIANPTAVNPTFVPDLLGTYVAQLIVNDGIEDSLPATVKITANDIAPVANAGPDQTIPLGATAILDASGSTDADGQPLTYRWSLLTVPVGSTATLQLDDPVHPQFTVDRAGTYVAQLIVNDGYLDGMPAKVVVSTINSIPVANPGSKQEVNAGTTVQLSGLGSTDADGDPLTYSWSMLSKPDGSLAAISDPTSSAPTFFADQAGVYVAQLIVNDGKTNSSPTTVMITAVNPNQPPSVNAGSDRTTTLPIDTIVLTGYASDDGLPNGVLTYEWSQVDGPATVSFASPNQLQTSATFSAVGNYTLQLAASDGQLTTSATTHVTVLAFDASNQPPVVSAGPNQTLVLPGILTLNGSASDDGNPVGGQLTVQWSMLSGPGIVNFANPAQAQTTATFTAPGLYILALTANDGQISTSSSVEITVTKGGPLTVNAGTAVTIVWPNNSTVLHATVTRDGQPISVPLNWTQMQGPASVTFDDASSSSPTATFTKPGTYVLRLTATDGSETASGDVLIFVGHTACARSNRGTNYWLAIPQSNGSDQSSTVLSLYLSGDASTTGTISVSGIGYSAPFTITPGQITTIQLPIGAKIVNSDVVESKGIHIVANDPIVAYVLDYVPAATDGYTALPTSMLGTDYIAISYPAQTAWWSGVSIPTHGSEFAVVASSDNTQVTITPRVTTGTHLAQVAYTVTLNQGQTYQLKNDQYPNNFANDLTGSLVHSDKPIAFFSGHDCNFMPGGTMACNHLVEQIPPLDQWGTGFVTVPLAARKNGDTFRIIASQDNTHVTINGTDAGTVNQGSFIQQSFAAPTQILADKPIAVVQYGNSYGTSFGPGNNGDPTMIYVPPYDSFGGSVTVETPTTGFPYNYVNVVAPAGAAGNLQLDGITLPPASFSPIGSSGFVSAQLPVNIGSHNLKADFPFLTTVYGYGSYDAYGYVGSVCLANSESGSTLTLTEHTLSAPLDSQQCITAQVSDPSGTPIGGVGVVFKATGVNTASSNAITNSDGQAQFCYVGQNHGSDLITADAIDIQDTATIQWNNNGPNQPPIVYAGPNQSLIQPANSLQLNGAVTDDGLPVGAALAIQWAQLSGPAQASFATPNAAVTYVTFPNAGTYVFQLSANDTELSTSSTVTVTVYPPNQPPVVTLSQSISATTGSAVQLGAAVTDDGLPTNTLTVSWAAYNGGSNVTFANPNLASTTATFATAGTYLLVLTASDGQFTVTKSMAVTVTDPILLPYCSMTPNTGTYLANNPVQIQAIPNLTMGSPFTSVQWSQSYGPGTISFSSTTAATTSATFPVAGNYGIYIKCFNSAGSYLNGSSFVIVQTTALPPVVSIGMPDGTEITKPTSLVGTVTTGNYTIAVAPVGSSNFVQIASGTGPITSGSLGTIDPTMMLNGQYTVRLSSYDAYGRGSTASVVVLVRGGMKIGNLNVAFADVSIPMPGMPIQVIRSYDSRDKDVGDFGIGWRLSIANARVSTNRVLGSDWYESAQYSGYFPQYCLQPTKYHFVTVVFPDGRVFKFSMAPTPQCQMYAPIEAPTLSFVQMPTGSSTAGAKLESLDDALIVSGSIPGNVDLVNYDAQPVNPTKFRLTTADGYVYMLDETIGVTSVTDPNGNTLTINANGVYHSSGQSVVFERDSQGRIIKITDPNGKSIAYEYYQNGDLLQMVDRTGKVTKFSYDNNHYLTNILDVATNISVLSNYYISSTHRLSYSTDGNARSTQFAPDLTAQTQVVTDRTGQPTTYWYDDRGNITQVKDALGNITSYTYDQDDNKLSETNALNKTTTYTYDGVGNRLTETDPLQHTTTYTYNNLKQVLTVKDPVGHTTTNTYDTKGNLLTTEDPNGKKTKYTYYSSGLPWTVTDPLSNTTTFAYDGRGNLTQQQDALGHTSSYTYDTNGNKLTQAVTRTKSDGTTETLTTQYSYDAQNHLLKTTYPDNTTTSQTYDSLGRRVTSTDQLNQTTQYFYDGDGRLYKTVYPDTSYTQTWYDGEGRVTSRRDRAGYLSNYVIDKVGHTTNITPPGSGTTITGYDTAGRVQTVTNPAGGVTTYGYDDAGRRTTVTDAYNHVTTYQYDDAGNQTAVIDARNNTTKFEYDNAGRRTKVIYPDQTFELSAYDDAGRMISKTDQAGKVTQYGYDKLGRLTSVTDALNQVTSYTYDELGNRLTQTDAAQHTTNFSYDKQGRRLSRTLPLGQAESYQYDDAGRLTARIDFNGKITAYGYDSNGWLLSKTPDPSFNAPAVIYTYYGNGKRKTMTDQFGTWTYNYDASGQRLFQKSNANFGTINHFWDGSGRLGRLQTTTPYGSDTTYAYDKMDRMLTAKDGWGNLLITYTYDEVGDLGTATYPNGVASTYTYDTLNRLTNISTAKGSTAVASYAYTLDPAGKRTGVTELNGRTVTYGYDDLYRLTSETIAGASAQNGTISYEYDPVGNRKSLTSTVPAIPSGMMYYDANDRISTDQYDNNGNTVSSGGVANVYDFENHLIQHGGITYGYDGDGNRVTKTIAGVTTKYMVTDANPTGYAQVLEEWTGTNFIPYTYGLTLLAQFNSSSPSKEKFYGYDGHGSVRYLTNTSGTVTDTYDYDAFGNLLSRTGNTYNNYRFAGEQFDPEPSNPDQGLYYNRARYLDVRTGRFWGMDTWGGSPNQPESFHKYLFAGADPVDRVDPGGNFSIGEFMIAATISIVLLTMPACNSGPKFVNVRMLAYEKVDYGVNIALIAYTKGRIPHYDKYRWVQQVTTNAIRKGDLGKAQPDVPYLDPTYGDGFYNTDAEQAESNAQFGDGDLNFKDRPTRDPRQNPEVHGTIYWHADLYLVGMTVGNSYDKITHIDYGFKVLENGETKVDDLHIVRLGS